MSVTPAGYVFFAVVAAISVAAYHITRGINQRVRDSGAEPNLLFSAYVSVVLFVIMSLVAGAVLMIGPLLLVGAAGAVRLVLQGEMPDASGEEIFGILSAAGGFGLMVGGLIFVLVGAISLARGKDMTGWIRTAQTIGLFVIIPMAMLWFLSGFVLVMYWHVTGTKVIEGSGWVVFVGAVIIIMVLAILGYVRTLLAGMHVKDE